MVGVAAYYLRRARFVEEGRTMLSMHSWLLTALVPLQIFLGDQHGLNTLEYQPAKLAAIEARWETASRVPLTLFAIPDQRAATNHYAIDIPELGSLILTHDPNGTVRGLKDWPADQRPPVAIPFFAFRIMVGIGLSDAGARRRQLGSARPPASVRRRLVSARLRDRLAARLPRRARRLDDDRGRPPALDRLWPVAHRRFGVALADRDRRPAVADRLCVVYLIMFTAGLILMARIVARGPAESALEPEPVESGRPRGPVSSAPLGRGEGGTMTQPIFDLVPVWTVILGLGVFFYVLLDGFDLGVGILYGFAADLASRNLVMNSIAPVWDGNETWLVLGGVGLLAAFPLAFAIILPAVYFPLLIMLLALVFRGVAFEFRYRDSEHRTFWDHGFCWGSRGRRPLPRASCSAPSSKASRPTGRHFSGGSFDCFTAVRAVHRARSLVRLWPPRGGLAGAEDRGRLAGLGAAPRTLLVSSACS